tara:strand:- start:115 stop:651 length:537 start_codon:yes stop_codon:yes gene_type:complete
MALLYLFSPTAAAILFIVTIQVLGLVQFTLLIIKGQLLFSQVMAVNPSGFRRVRQGLTYIKTPTVTMSLSRTTLEQLGTFKYTSSAAQWAGKNIEKDYIMEITVHNFITDGDTKQVTIEVLYNSKPFYITKNINTVSGKTTEQYVAEAITASQDEIDAWKSDTAPIGKKFNAETGAFV